MATENDIVNRSTQFFQHPSRLYRFVRFVIVTLVRLYYPRIEVAGRDNLPAQGPVIFVLNHPNGLLDPMMLMAGLNRPVAFLAKSTLFGNPFGKFFMEAFGALPIYRRQDEGIPGGPQGGDSRLRNEETFAYCRALLGQREAMALFPEGKTHSGPQLVRIRSGAARIALSAEDEFGWGLGLQIVPVGIWYQSKINFRTSVLLVVGQSFDLANFEADYVADAEQAIQKLTEQIEEGLDQVVLQAENAELLAAIPVVAAWTAPEGEPLDLSQQHEWATKLMSAYERLQASDPTRLEAVARQARDYANILRMFGINNPWDLELPKANRWRPVGLGLVLALSFLMALAGFILSYIPYRLAGPIATLVVGRYETQISTFKLIIGSFLVLMGWIVEAVVCGQWLGWPWGVLLFVVAPPLAYVALRWGEIRHELFELAATRWLRTHRGRLVQSLIAQRQALAQQVIEAIQAVSA